MPLLGRYSSPLTTLISEANCSCPKPRHGPQPGLLRFVVVDATLSPLAFLAASVWRRQSPRRGDPLFIVHARRFADLQPAADACRLRVVAPHAWLRLRQTLGWVRASSRGRW